jgi:hypothetical protein
MDSWESWKFSKGGSNAARSGGRIAETPNQAGFHEARVEMKQNNPKKIQ